MRELAVEIFPYLLTIIGFLAVLTLNGIKSEIKEIKTTVKALEGDLRGSLTDLDRRVAHIEGRCKAEHAG